MPRTTEKSELQNNLLETAKSLMLLDAEPDDVEPFLLFGSALEEACLAERKSRVGR